MYDINSGKDIMSQMEYDSNLQISFIEELFV